MSKKEFMDILLDEKEREYVSFLIQDWRNERIVEWTSNPDQLGNYFVESDLPFEISPAFFKKEVLKNYKDNPEKYKISHYRIECRNTWSMPYSVNEADQVIVYIIDLSRLPYKEQLHWKIYNDEPKSPISESNFRRDFLGEWVEDEDPLNDLKKEIQKDINIRNQIVWESPSQEEIDSIHYLTSEIQKEWENDISILNMVIVESFKKSVFRKILNEMTTFKNDEQKRIEKLGSIKLLQLLLQKKSVDEEIIEKIISPLSEVNYIRRKISDHKQGSEGRTKVKEVKQKFGTFKQHQKDLIIGLRDSLMILRKVFQ